MDVWGTTKDVLRSVAPVLGTAVGGPFGGMAARAITGALLGEESDDEGDAAAAIRGATPEQLLALKKADLDFAAQMKALEVDLEKVGAADRADARAMATATGTRMPGMIAAVALTGFFAILSALIFVPIPTAAERPLDIMLGVLGTLITQIAAYYYGSSKGSADKASTIDKLVGGAGGR
ncbi:MAG: hypothetical protein K9H25_23060 [Rhodospirillum sp.]|nr:hypothetical protein [Rhodospirillum sp.]MCF8491374.1 hypothetical protein [Rhodospirillum sp.]MCF8500198.1 hypothetical protein [Rhodospirillum sp.]